VTWTRLIVPVVGYLAVVALCVGCKRDGAGGSWSGRVSAWVEIRVVDQATDRPVSGARVWLLTAADALAYQAFQARGAEFSEINGPIERFGSRVFTDRDGCARIYTPFDAAGGFSSMGSTLTHRYVSGFVIVEHGQFTRFESKLEDLMSIPATNLGKNLPRVSVALVPLAPDPKP